MFLNRSFMLFMSSNFESSAWTFETIVEVISEQIFSLNFNGRGVSRDGSWARKFSSVSVTRSGSNGILTTISSVAFFGVSVGCGVEFESSTKFEGKNPSSPVDLLVPRHHASCEESVTTIRSPLLNVTSFSSTASKS